MSEIWVDFSAVKVAVTMQMVIEHYGITNLKTERGELVGRCPIHRGEGERAFHVNYKKNCFQCFSCRNRGNVLDFVAAMEQCGVRDAALKLRDWFHLTAHEDRSKARASTPRPAREQQGTEVVETNAKGEREQMINKPLGFELKGIDPAHSYLSARGLRRETIETFGVGYFSGKGSMAGRIVIPIHNEGGELIAYAGRSVDNADPKYKVPAGFQKSRVLFNLHRAISQDDYLVVLVEGFFDTLILHQAGFPTTVALMGCQLSATQDEMLTSHFEEAIILMDGDEAGRSAAGEIAGRLVRNMFVRVVDLEPGQQPDGLSAEAIRELLSSVL